ncbi:GeoRSP system SPASM domain protein [Geobacter pickeringii]|uniref:Iron-sulfur cluster-binding oxidoreductase n=1 Tax=Geobacter pickeringii TaxID=345632 RepID=A0A0B5BD59_9BACT|nr:GeoRSP system SPASM domain protein [Geobacter pickeringii]AJE02485.1 iron-sulfur cluster-binding oxidoreductase [Geobacter pickeringii]
MELATPITIHWDLPPPPADADFLLRIAADIVACRPLMLQLTAFALPPDDGLRAVLERLREEAITVSLTVPLARWDDTAREACGEVAVKEILLAVDSPDELRFGEGTVPALAGISFTVTPSNWCSLPPLVSLCRQRGIRRLVLPMQRLYGGEAPFFLTAEEQGELTAALAAAGGVAELNLTIHDPFLWRAFYPGVPFPQGGCQAANTMLAIAPDGGVYPCPTLPVRLGSLATRSLTEIAASADKREFRRRLLEPPAACGECGVRGECRGGCRGRAYVMHDSMDGADPACR